VLAANMRWGFWPALFVDRRGLVVHLTLGLGGWFGLMVVGTFYRLVPLVHGARVAAPHRGWAILGLGVLAIGGVLTGAVWGLGWVTQAIIGQLYKITPFLMWYYRATIPDMLAIPRQPAPYNPRPGRAVLWLSNLGVAGLALGIWLAAAPVAEGGAVLLAGAAF